MSIKRSVKLRVMVAALALASVCPAAATRSTFSPWQPVAECELIVVGELAPGAESGPRTYERTSKLAVTRAIYGPASPGDTVEVYWQTSERVREEQILPDGRHVFTVDYVESGPKLSEFAGRPAVWLLRSYADGQTSAVDGPMLLGRDRQSELQALLESPVSPIDDPGSLRKVVALARYLEGYLDGLNEAQ